MCMSYEGQISQFLPDGWKVVYIDAGGPPNTIYFYTESKTNCMGICTNHDMFWRYPDMLKWLIEGAITSSYRDRYLVPYVEEP